MSISQIDLISGIAKLLERHGHKRLPVRQMNTIIRAATDIVNELNSPYRPVTPEMGYVAWLASDETGLSSKFMASYLNGGRHQPIHWPHDASDFGRCVGLLVAMPELRCHLNELANAGPQWAALVERWEELEAEYRALQAGDGGKDLTDKIRQCVGE